jgi:GT2 family glycosyltransferase
VESTVVIPSYNREAQLKSCLASLSAQDASFDWQVVVVNDGGKNLDHLIKAYPKLNLRVVNQVNAGPAHARNEGVRLAEGARILFLDDDCEARPDWVRVMSTELQPNSLIAGKTENKSTKYPCSEASQVLLDYLMQSLKGTAEYFFTSNNLAIYREDFLRLGGFDLSFRRAAGEDREFCVRAHYLGFDLNRCETAIIDHSHQLSFWQFWKMHFKYGRATRTYKSVKKTRALKFKPVIIRGFHIRMLLYPLRQKRYSYLYRFYLSWLIAWSQLATLAGFLFQRITKPNA